MSGSGPKHAGVAILALALLAPLQLGLEFTNDLPSGLPSLGGWEKVTGSAEFGNPRFSVHYEFYVNPAFNGRYEVIRYRVTGGRSDEPGKDYRPTERLQWQAGTKDVRRYECQPEGEGSPCRWRELRKGSEEYHRETSVVLWLLGLHRRLLWEREEGQLPR